MATLAPTSTLASKATPPTTGRTNSGGFKTTDGTIYVSQPFRSKSSKKLRALITFAPRKSHFDTTNERSGTNEFRVRTILDSGTRFLILLRPYPGFLHSVLDIYVLVHCQHLYQQCREERLSLEFCVCHHVIEGCRYIGHQRRRTGLNDWFMRAVRQGD